MSTLTKTMCLPFFDSFKVFDSHVVFNKTVPFGNNIIELPVKELSFNEYKKGILTPLDKQLFVAVIVEGNTSGHVRSLNLPD